jgi:hypothetical protein
MPDPRTRTRGSAARARLSLADAFDRSTTGKVLDKRGYVSRPEENLLPGISMEDVVADLRAGSGNELAGKFCAVHSSSALAVNAFAPFRRHAAKVPFPIDELSVRGTIGFERQCPTGLARATPPNLDVMIEGPSEVIGIESKLTEHLNRHRARFSPRYAEVQDVEWRDTAYFSEMERLRSDPNIYQWLDAAQLIKHAYGLMHTFPQRTTRLLYMYWEPSNAADHERLVEHRSEVEHFAIRVAGSGPKFRAMSYGNLWDHWSLAESSWLTSHVANLRSRYWVEM